MAKKRRGPGGNWSVHWTTSSLGLAQCWKTSWPLQQIDKQAAVTEAATTFAAGCCMECVYCLVSLCVCVVGVHCTTVVLGTLNTLAFPSEFALCPLPSGFLSDFTDRSAVFHFAYFSLLIFANIFGGENQQLNEGRI